MSWKMRFSGGRREAAAGFGADGRCDAVLPPVGADGRYDAVSGNEPATLLHKPSRRRLGGRKTTLAVCIASAFALMLLAVCGALSQQAAATTDFAGKLSAPSLAHPFGTDMMGRDMLSRTLAGLSTSVLLGLAAACASSLIAIVLGLAAALGGRRADAIVNWMIDLMMGVPHIVLLVLISYALGRGFWGVCVGIALTHWASLARIVRAEVLQCKQSQFVAVARRLGASPAAIARDHMVPYVFPQFIVGLILLFPHAILHEAAITFLGFGLSPDTPAIGVILSESMSYLSMGSWWLAVFPGLALVLAVVLFDLCGQNLRKLIDPHTAQG